MKKEGIYVTISPVLVGQRQTRARAMGHGGLAGERVAVRSLVLQSRSFRRATRPGSRALLTRPNPYTGIPLAQDPAVAIIQLQNEDSLLFWTAQSIKGKQAELLGPAVRRMAQDEVWLARGGVPGLGKRPRSGRQARQGIVGLLLVWEWTQPRQGGRKRRLDDQLQFYAETMYRFNREIERYLREELGCKQLVNAGNWRTADSAKLDDAERWSYTANEVIAVNRYYSPIHMGPDRGWRIDPGD